MTSLRNDAGKRKNDQKRVFIQKSRKIIEPFNGPGKNESMTWLLVILHD
jgi:hypothetical protein